MIDEHDGTAPAAPTRRALLLGAGAVGAAAFLGGCSSDEPAQPAGDGATNDGATNDGATTEGPTTAATDGPAAAALATTSEIAVGGGVVKAAEGVVITQPTAGEFKGFSAICTHQRCPIASVADGAINCTCHGSRFSLADGSPMNGPATKPLPPRAITVNGDTISLA